jgi:hypothetical protein
VANKKSDYCVVSFLFKKRQKKIKVIMMNASPSSTNTTTFQNSPIIRIAYPRATIDQKPDEQTLDQRSFLLCPQSSATVPQIVNNILNPVVSTVPSTNTSNVSGMLPTTKKCTFHRQCLHIQQSGQQQQQQQIQNAPHMHQQPQHSMQQQQQQQQHQQLYIPSSQQSSISHPQIFQQPVRISVSNISNSNCNNSNTVANRNSTQANRDAISSNVQLQYNAALLQDRYLLLDMVDGSSFYKCIDIQTQKLLVCKVRVCICLLAFLFFKNNDGGDDKIWYPSGKINKKMWGFYEHCKQVRKKVHHTESRAIEKKIYFFSSLTNRLFTS